MAGRIKSRRVVLCGRSGVGTFVVILDDMLGKIYEKVSWAAYPKSKIRNIDANVSRAKP